MKTVIEEGTMSQQREIARSSGGAGTQAGGERPSATRVTPMDPGAQIQGSGPGDRDMPPPRLRLVRDVVLDHVRSIPALCADEARWRDVLADAAEIVPDLAAGRVLGTDNDDPLAVNLAAVVVAHAQILGISPKEAARSLREDCPWDVPTAEHTNRVNVNRRELRTVMQTLSSARSAIAGGMNERDRAALIRLLDRTLRLAVVRDCGMELVAGAPATAVLLDPADVMQGEVDAQRAAARKGGAL